MSKSIKWRPYQKTLIRHQKRFMNDDSIQRATILAATGAGKTEVFQELIWDLLRSDNGRCKRILIVYPRIALAQHQQMRFRRTLESMPDKNRLIVEFTNFHSGKAKYHTLPRRKNVSTTDRTALLEIMDNAAHRGHHHITFSSYASLHKIVDMNFDLIVFDEAHYLVQPDLRDNLYNIQSKALFYTGTPVNVVCAEESMNNPELFGKIIANIPPRALIPKGYIVRPRIKTVNIRTKEDGNTEDYVSAIAWAFEDQLRHAHKKFVHKMLVTMPNTKYMQDISNDLARIRAMVGNNNIDIYHVTANTAVKNSNIVMDREDLLADFADNPQPCIIMHCDTLTEGIDVDGIGGCLLARNLGKTSAIQTIGRCCRPASEDVIKSGKSRGEIKKFSKRIKKECIVTIIRSNDQWSSDANLKHYAAIFEEAGYLKKDFWDDIEFEMDVGRPKLDAIDGEIKYKTALECRITEGMEDRFWELFPDNNDEL